MLLSSKNYSSSVTTIDVFAHTTVELDFDPRPISPISECSDPSDDTATSIVVGFGRRRHVLPPVADRSQDLTQSTIVGFGRKRHLCPQYTDTVPSDLSIRKHENRRSLPLTSIRKHDNRQSLPVNFRLTKGSLDLNTLNSAIAWEATHSVKQLVLLQQIEAQVQESLRSRVKRRLVSKVRLAASSRPVQLLAKRFLSQPNLKPLKIGRDLEEHFDLSNSFGETCVPLNPFLRLIILLLIASYRALRNCPMWI